MSNGTLTFEFIEIKFALDSAIWIPQHISTEGSCGPPWPLGQPQACLAFLEVAREGVWSWQVAEQSWVCVCFKAFPTKSFQPALTLLFQFVSCFLDTGRGEGGTRGGGAQRQHSLAKAA